MSIILYTIIFTPTTNRSRGLNPQTGARLPDKGLSRLLNFFPHQFTPYPLQLGTKSPLNPTFLPLFTPFSCLPTHKQHLGNSIKLIFKTLCHNLQSLFNFQCPEEGLLDRNIDK